MYKRKLTKNMTCLEATDILVTHYLNDSNTSWIKLVKLKEPDGLSQYEFENLWKLKPTEKQKIKLFGKIIETPRYSKSYLKSYHFSGLTSIASEEIPVRIGRLLEYSKKINPESITIQLV